MYGSYNSFFFKTQIYWYIYILQVALPVVEAVVVAAADGVDVFDQIAVGSTICTIQLWLAISLKVFVELL